MRMIEVSYYRFINTLYINFYLGSPLFKSKKHQESIGNYDVPPLTTSNGEERKSFYISSKFKHNKKAKSKNFKLFQKKNLDKLFGAK